MGLDTCSQLLRELFEAFPVCTLGPYGLRTTNLRIDQWPKICFFRPRQPQSYEVVCWNMQKELSLTSFFYFTLRGADLLLFYARSIRVEATKLLSLLPCEDTIGPMLVLCRWHLILVDG